MKGHLKGLRNSLEGARKKWVAEENAIEAKRSQITETLVAKALQNEERRRAFEARWAEVKARNAREMDEGTFEGPIVPIGFRPPEPKVQKTSASEDKVEEVSFFRLVDEPPEGVARYSEGGSSGSGGPVKPVEADPPEPPLEEPSEPPLEEPSEPPPAPPPLEEPSNGELVKRKLAEAGERLQNKTYLDLEDEFVASAKLEDLRPEDRDNYEKVRGSGLGICARCRFLSGCQSCDEHKAWSFACRSTLWHTADLAVRPKAKPRGRPKKAAAKA